MIKATDVGYSHSKATDQNGERVIIPSVWGEPQDSLHISGISQNGHKQIGIDNKGVWFVGNSAIEDSRFQTRYQNRYWFKEAGYLALHLYLLSEMTEATNPTIQLVTGLPISYYKADKGLLAEILKGVHQIQRPGRVSQRITIDRVICLPQGLSAVFSEALTETGKIKNNDIADGNIGVIDIGGHTVNISTMKKLQPIDKETASLDKAGMWTVIDDIGKKINDAFPGQNLKGHEIIEVMKTGEVRQRGHVHDVNNLIISVVEPFINQITGITSQTWDEAARLDKILVVGGGAQIVGKAIMDRYEHAQVINNPQWANVDGYLRYGRRVLER